MAQPTDDRLRRILQREVEQLAAETVDADGEINTTKLERVEHLAALVEAQAGLPQGQNRGRWSIAALLLGTLFLVSLLFFGRVNETKVELAVRVSELGFVVPTRVALTDILPVSAIGVSGLEQIVLPLKPDIVLVNYCMNDTLPNEDPYDRARSMTLAYLSGLEAEGFAATPRERRPKRAESRAAKRSSRCSRPNRPWSTAR